MLTLLKYGTVTEAILKLDRFSTPVRKKLISWLFSSTTGSETLLLILNSIKLIRPRGTTINSIRGINMRLAGIESRDTIPKEFMIRGNVKIVAIRVVLRLVKILSLNVNIFNG